VGFDLDAYLERIGYEGSRSPSLETLSAIHLAHAQTIPFENLDPYLKRPVLLDIESLQKKLVLGGRGGYCFEQNLLLSHALKTLGFDVTGLAARVLWNVTDDAVRPRSHMLLLINLNGAPLIADAGFGGLTLTGPLRLEANVEQSTPHETFRLLRAGEDFVMQANISGNWKPLYRFDLQPQFQADYEVTNWYLSHHPNSRFVTGLIAARPDRDRRYALLDREFAIHHLHGSSEKSTLADGTELRTALEEKFRINLAGLPLEQ